MKGKNTGLDIFVILFCLCGIVCSLYLFQQDLFTSLRSMNNTPAGTVTIKHNTVQRRLQDRVVWDRLFNDSPVYNGDLIRISRLSGATLNIDESQIELGENTLIRIQKDEGPLQIDFFSGGINIASSKDSKVILLSIGDRVIEASPGSVFSASSGDEGLVLRVTEGEAQIAHKNDGQVVTASAGTVFAEDARGNRVIEPFVSMIRPALNARLLKADERPLQTEFAWNRINMQSQDKLRLEVASDRNFTNIVQSANNLDTRISVPLFTGFWYWRLSLEDAVSNEQSVSNEMRKVLASGRLTVAESPAPVALSPQPGRTFNMRAESPEIQLRWTEIPEAIYYQLQISPVSDFFISEMNVDVQGTSYITGNLNAGTWFWRVLPVFPNKEDEKKYSQVASFNIQQNRELTAPVLNSPSPDSTFVLGEDRGSLFFSWAHERESENYKFQISKERNLSNPVISRTIKDNFFIYDNKEIPLAPGRYYWGISYNDVQGNQSPISQIRSFFTAESEITQKLIFPPDRYTFDAEQLKDLSFSWETNLSFDKRFQVSSSSDFSVLEIDESVNGNSFSGIDLSQGQWYWRITAKPDSRSVEVPAAARRFTMTDIKAQEREQLLREQALREQEERERAAQLLLAREAAEREQAMRDQLARDQAARDQAAREQAARDQAARELAAREQAAREQAAREQAAREQAARERAEREQAAMELAAREQAAQTAREQAARAQAVRVQAVREQTAQQIAAQTEAAQAERERAEQQTAAVQQTEPAAVEQTAAITTSPQREVSRIQTDALPLFLLTPDSGIVIPGLLAIRQPIVFRWDTSEEVASSKFIISRNANPSSRPYYEEINPERTITLNNLGSGVWYWTVEARTPDGKLIAPREPRQIRVLTVPLLPAPENRFPANNEHISTQNLRLERSILFRWSQVEGANHYIFSIYRETVTGKRQIFQTSPISELSYTFKNLSILENSGNFSWQVEAIFYNREGKIEQRGQIGENVFVLDVQRPSRIRTRDTGVLYGTE
ncbi:MAG: hypothetical protein FWB86_09685 [Treponema sp.]|nr:hypothetical protein [Treponema sp.]MCL2251921.1 hypothetical protein [Treponema sp.]